MTSLDDLSEQGFVLLMHTRGVPSMAGCVYCGRKFFTPNSADLDYLGAMRYLQEKFDGHDCKVHPGKYWQR